MNRILVETLLKVGWVIILCITALVVGCVPVDWGAPVSPVSLVSPSTGNVKETTVGVGLVIFLVFLWFWSCKYDK